MKKIFHKFKKLVTILSLRANYNLKPINVGQFVKKNDIVINRALDLGSGPEPRNMFGAKEIYGADIRAYDTNNLVKRCVIGSQSIPFSDNYFDAVTAFDVLEHIPRIANENSESRFPFIFAMNEIWRVMKKGGIFYSITPCYPMNEAFQDPTHVNIMTEDTMRLYFTGKSWARIYGFTGSFELLTEGWLGSHYYCILQKSSDQLINGINSNQK